MCVIWGAMAGAVVGAFPGSRVSTAIGAGLLVSATGTAFLASWRRDAAAHGTIIGGLIGALFGAWHPYQNAVGGLPGAIVGAIACAIGGAVLGLVATLFGRTLPGGKR